MQTPERTQLFVYGTLKRGDIRASLLNGQALIGNAQTTPYYRLFNTGAYPAMVEAAPIHLEGLSIFGELWAVDQACLERLDEEEGVDEGLYERRWIELGGSHGRAMTYLYLQSIDGLADCGVSWDPL